MALPSGGSEFDSAIELLRINFDAEPDHMTPSDPWERARLDPERYPELTLLDPFRTADFLPIGTAPGYIDVLGMAKEPHRLSGTVLWTAESLISVNSSFLETLERIATRIEWSIEDSTNQKTLR